MYVAELSLADVSPALEKYDRDVLLKLWTNPELSPRDRSIVTLSALIARNQTIELPFYVQFALDHGVKPGEISELITHLAFYSGWSNAVAAINVVRPIFNHRKVSIEDLPEADPQLLPLNEESERERANHVKSMFDSTAPRMVQITTDVLFKDLWLRPGLHPRDRSLITVSALIAIGAVNQIPYHLNRAMDNGLSPEQASETLTHLALYAGWPNVFSAMPIVKEVFAKRDCIDNLENCL